MNILLTQTLSNFLGPLQLAKMEVKFFTSLWRSLISCLFVRKGLSCRKYVLSDYLPEINVLIRYLKTQTWFLCSRSKFLHLIVEKVNKLNMCQQIVFRCRYIKSKAISKSFLSFFEHTILTQLQQLKLEVKLFTSL